MKLFAYSATEAGIARRAAPVALLEPVAPATDNVVQFIPRTRAQQLVAEIAHKHGLTYADLIGPRRFHRLVVVRDEAMAAVRKLSTDRLSYSLPMIGRIFGGRDHTTVLTAIRRHEAKSHPTLSREKAT